MLDFGEFCFQHVQKTGGSFVRAFLKQCCNLSVKKDIGHKVVNTDFEPHKAYFATVRHPLSFYTSLYRFGCDRRGQLFHNLQESGLDNVYSGDENGFFAWLDLVLDERQSENVSKGYSEFAHLGIGLLTFRFLCQSMAYPKKKMKKANDYKELQRIYSNNNILSFVIRNECLNDGLSELVVSRWPEYFDLEKSKAFLKKPKINSSSIDTISPDSITRYPRINRLYERERFIIDTFYKGHEEEEAVGRIEPIITFERDPAFGGT